MRSFEKDIAYGKIGEKIFEEDFLKFLNVKYENVTDCQQFQIIDSDFLSAINTVEVKTNYKDNRIIIIEEYTNINSIEPDGWFYKTKADLLVFLSKITRTMIFVPFSNRFKEYYEKIKNKFILEKNNISSDKLGNTWQSAFRRIPLRTIKGYYSVYKKIEKEA